MKLLCFTCAGLLLLALGDLPIGYYTFLRIVITIGAVAVIINEFEGEVTPWIVVFGIIGVIFNPIIPVYLHDRELWAVIDVVAAVLFGIKAFNTK